MAARTGSIVWRPSGSAAMTCLILKLCDFLPGQLNDFPYTKERAGQAGEVPEKAPEHRQSGAKLQGVGPAQPRPEADRLPGCQFTIWDT